MGRPYLKTWALRKEWEEVQQAIRSDPTPDLATSKGRASLEIAKAIMSIECTADEVEIIIVDDEHERTV
jgi:hypothetical protein